MHRSIRLFLSLLIVVISAHPTRAQQTAPGPVTDTAKPANTTKKPVFTLKTLRIRPLYIFDVHDNAKIDAQKQFPGSRAVPDSFHYAGETHLKNLRQLTFQGTNMGPSLSPDDQYIVFQAHGIKPNTCDQIYRLPLAEGVPAGRISNGSGRATGAAFLGSDRIVYSSTQAVNGGACPADTVERPWPLDGEGDLYTADSNGKQLARLTNDGKHFAADASVSPNGERIVFTQTMDSDAEIVAMDPNGKNVSRLTHDHEYHGDPSYSPNRDRIVFCAGHPFGKPKNFEIYVMNADGSGVRQLTHSGGINMDPSWMPDGEHIIFSSNHLGRVGRIVELFIVKADGTGLEQITHGGGFNGFPVFTHDGKQLIFCSSRNAAHPGDVNIFVADWVP